MPLTDVRPTAHDATSWPASGAEVVEVRAAPAPSAATGALVEPSRPGHLIDDLPIPAVVGALLAGASATGVASTWAGPLAGACVAVLLVAVATSGALWRRAAELGRQVADSERRTRIDPLTGLWNRDGVTAEVERRLRTRRPSDVVGVLLLDVDRFKVVNHSLGHGAGDEVLLAIAGRLRAAVRPGDAVGRSGGDEFVVVTSGFRSLADLDRLAGRMLSDLGRPVVLGDGSRQVVTASIGIAYLLKGQASAQDLLRDADVAMYRAKDGGGSCHVAFDSELRSRSVARVELARELRQAVRDGELVVQYQPIVAGAHGTIEVVEALVRWRHPTRGLLPPDQFLTVASESGLILELGRHVLLSACREAVRWSSASGRAIGVAVNLAERQLLDPDLIPGVAEVLQQTGLPASQLQLEVSEELLAHRPERCLEVLRRLAALGVVLALDDFGTTRGSLCQLKSLDMVRTLKLDRTFVADVTGDGVDRGNVSAVLALASSLGMEVVAEGVETAGQAEVLRALGVHHLQGFHLQRPTEVEAITALLTS